MKDLKITKGEMKDEERKQLLKDTLLFFAATDRYVTDEKGIKYYREDVTLKAMELSEKLPSELLQQRDELKEALAEQKRLYFSLFDEETSCMYCEAKIRRGSAIILCKECAENTEV